MKGDEAFFDTNVLIYAFAGDDARTGIAEGLLARGGRVGVQTLNEFVAVAVRKLACLAGNSRSPAFWLEFP